VRGGHFAALLAAGLFVAGGCGGTATGTSDPFASVPVGVDQSCLTVQTFDPNSPLFGPSFPPDSQLEAKFPAQIDGQPVTQISSFYWAQAVCFYNGPAGVDELASSMPGINPQTLSFGSAAATVDGEPVTITAFRSPGQDGDVIVQWIAQLASGLGDQAPTGTLSQGSILGRNVYLWTDDDDGSITYGYVSGDTLFGLSGVDGSQATKVIAALP
jgi:hypothetical protein